MIYDLFGSLCGCGNSFRLWPFMLTHELITRFCFLASKSNVLETRFLHSMVDWNKSGSFIEKKVANHTISSIKKRSAFFHSPHIFSKGNRSDSRMLEMWSRGFLSKAFLETKFPSECIALPKGIVFTSYFNWITALVLCTYVRSALPSRSKKWGCKLIALKKLTYGEAAAEAMDLARRLTMLPRFSISWAAAWS